MDNLVLVFVVGCCLTAILGYGGWLLISALLKWVAKHWLPLITIILAFLTFVLVGEGTSFAVICVGGTVAIIRWLRSLKKD